MSQLSSSELKKLKELHVSNNVGSGKFDIISIGLNPILNIVLWSLIKKLNLPNSFILSVTLEFLTLILPLLTAILFANHIILINFAISSLILVLYIILPKEEEVNNKKEGNIEDIKIKPYLTQYRANLMILTCICILAVDFNIFPKKLAKVESFGTSLMDVGVGAFVFSSGVVNSKQRPANSSKFKLILKSFSTSLPLWILGFFRLISVKGLEYQEHVTEYGVHWNFFFTLASLPPLTQLVDLVPINEALKPWIIGISYQLLLSFTNLESYILNSPRTNLINMNREGIFSILGYLSIFLIGKTTGKLIFNSLEAALSSKLISSTLIYAAIDFIIDLLDFKNSRRMTNLPYITWVSSFNLGLISMFYFVNLKSKLNTISLILNSLNFNSLLTFLWANILTGLTNMSINTLSVSDHIAFFILSIYIVLVLIPPLVLYKLKIKIF